MRRFLQAIALLALCGTVCAQSVPLFPLQVNRTNYVMTLWGASPQILADVLRTNNILGATNIVAGAVDAYNATTRTLTWNTNAAGGGGSGSGVTTIAFTNTPPSGASIAGTVLLFPTQVFVKATADLLYDPLGGWASNASAIVIASNFFGTAGNSNALSDAAHTNLTLALGAHGGELDPNWAAASNAVIQWALSGQAANDRCWITVMDTTTVALITGALVNWTNNATEVRITGPIKTDRTNVNGLDRVQVNLRNDGLSTTNYSGITLYHNASVTLTVDTAASAGFRVMCLTQGFPSVGTNYSYCEFLIDLGTSTRGASFVGRSGGNENNTTYLTSTAAGNSLLMGAVTQLVVRPSLATNFSIGSRIKVEIR